MKRSDVTCPECKAGYRRIELVSKTGAGHALWPELDVARQDLVVLKRRFGAFVPGSSDLHARLQERGIDTLIISGTLSQVCCEATARDAMMMKYKVFFISDACATLTDAEQGGRYPRWPTHFATYGIRSPCWT